jgi:hypothetical protein
MEDPNKKVYPAVSNPMHQHGDDSWAPVAIPLAISVADPLANEPTSIPVGAREETAVEAVAKTGQVNWRKHALFMLTLGVVLGGVAFVLSNRNKSYPRGT